MRLSSASCWEVVHLSFTHRYGHAPPFPLSHYTCFTIVGSSIVKELEFITWIALAWASVSTFHVNLPGSILSPVWRACLFLDVVETGLGWTFQFFALSFSFHHLLICLKLFWWRTSHCHVLRIIICGGSFAILPLFVFVELSDKSSQEFCLFLLLDIFILKGCSLRK